MQYLELFTANLDKLTAILSNDPAASLAAGALLGVLIFFLLMIFLQRRNKKKFIRFQEETERKYESLQETLSLKTRNIAILEQICQEQKDELADANEQIARLEESVKYTPVLEEKVEQQLRQIEALTETIAGELDFNQSSAPSYDSFLSPEATEPLTKEAVIDHLGNRLYQQLSTLHRQIAEQSRLITDLQAELNAKKETVARQIIAKSQQLPKIAKTRIDERVIEPIHMRVDGLKQTVQAFPGQTRAKIDQLLIDPIYRKVSEIKTGLSQIPVQTSAQLNKIVLNPLNKFVYQINHTAKNISAISREKFDLLVTKQLHNLIAQFKLTGQSLSMETRENLKRLIIHPLEKLLAEIKQKVSALQEHGGTAINERVVQPTMQKLQAISEYGKQLSFKGIKNAGNRVIDSVAQSSAPAAAT